MNAWPAASLRLISAAHELQIAVGSRRPVPIWVVTANSQVYARTWYRRDTGWYGAALRTGRAFIRVPGLEAAVTVEDIGSVSSPDVDAAYRNKYGPGASSMVTAEATATTLQFIPE